MNGPAGQPGRGAARRERAAEAKPKARDGSALAAAFIFAHFSTAPGVRVGVAERRGEGRPEEGRPGGVEGRGPRRRAAGRPAGGAAEAKPRQEKGCPAGSRRGAKAVFPVQAAGAAGARALKLGFADRLRRLVLDLHPHPHPVPPLAAGSFSYGPNPGVPQKMKRSGGAVYEMKAAAQRNLTAPDRREGPQPRSLSAAPYSAARPAAPAAPVQVSLKAARPACQRCPWARRSTGSACE